MAPVLAWLALALMYDANGKLLWTNTNVKAYAANDVAFGPDNVSYFATGTYSPLDSAPYQMAIAKFNAAGYGPGATVWAKGLIGCESIPEAMLWQQV